MFLACGILKACSKVFSSLNPITALPLLLKVELPMAACPLISSLNEFLGEYWPTDGINVRLGYGDKKRALLVFILKPAGFLTRESANFSSNTDGLI